MRVLEVYETSVFSGCLWLDVTVRCKWAIRCLDAVA